MPNNKSNVISIDRSPAAVCRLILISESIQYSVQLVAVIVKNVWPSHVGPAGHVQHDDISRYVSCTMTASCMSAAASEQTIPSYTHRGRLIPVYTSHSNRTGHRSSMQQSENFQLRCTIFGSIAVRVINKQNSEISYYSA